MFNYNGWNCKVQDNNLVCSYSLDMLNNMNKNVESVKTGASAEGDKLSNFYNFLNNNGKGLCCVYSNHCGHCIHLIENCGNAWNVVQKQKGKNGILLLDAGNPEEMEMYKKLGIKVDGVPTTVIFKGNKPVNFDRGMFIENVKAGRLLI